MKIGIIGAMDEEVKAFKDKMDTREYFEKAGKKFYIGSLHHHDVIVVTSGIGKVNAASCTQILVDTFDVETIINIGIAGGLRDGINPGDVVIANSLVEHDVDVSFFNGDKLGQIPNMDVYDFKCDENLLEKSAEAIKNLDINYSIGRIVSGDQFIFDREKQLFLSEYFDAYAVEMEGASIGHVCYLNHMPFIVIRSISDNAVIGEHMNYETFKDIALENSINILDEILKTI